MYSTFWRARAILECAASGEETLDVLCVEGSVTRGPKGTGRYHILSGNGQPMLHWITGLAARARHVVAVGPCAALGGVISAGGNPSGAVGLQYEVAHPGGALPASFRSLSGLPVINVAGRPTHPDRVTETLLMLASGTLGADALDGYARPRRRTGSVATPPPTGSRCRQR